MFSIILTILGIVLVGVLTLASIYFLGDRTEEARREADVARMINNSHQVRGALEMFTVDHPGQALTSIESLTPNYLREVPAGNWSLNPQGVVAPIDTEASCKAFNKRTGIGDIAPTCDDPAYEKLVVCCSTGAVEEEV